MEITGTGIGGGDISAVLGINPYKSAYDVWLNKTGQSKFAGNEFTEAGLKLEPFILDWYADIHGLTFKETATRNIQENYLYNDGRDINDRGFALRKDKDYPELVAAYDALQGSDLVIEAKLTSKKIDELPMDWFCQLQWYAGILKRKVRIVWVETPYSFDRSIFNKMDNVDYKVLRSVFSIYERDVAPDYDFIQSMRIAGVAFWNDHVLTGIAPEPQTMEDAKRIHPDALAGNVIEMPYEGLNIYDRYNETVELIKELKTEQDGLKTDLRLIAKDAEIVNFDGKPVYKFARQERKIFDKNRAVKDYEIDIDKYTKVSNSEILRRLRK